MKQFDTIKNNEWLPTEEDLEEIVQVTESLPVASAKLLGKTFLLNGSMDKYIKSHFYKCVADAEAGSYTWEDLNVGRYSVGNCKNIKLVMFDDGSTCRVLMCWEDPDDVIIESERLYWRETRLVYQVGHMPADVTDGTVILTNTVRDRYKTLGSFSTTIDNAGNSRHYFKLFPVSQDGGVTNDDVNGRVAGYNYSLTSSVAPYQREGKGTAEEPYTYTYPKRYFKRTYNAQTGVYTYTECSTTPGSADYTWTEATEYDPSHATFTSSEEYYEYRNAFINWAGIQELVKGGEAEEYFPTGTILTLPYHGDFGEMSYEVVDYDTVQPADGNIRHTMTLEAKYLNTWWDYTNGVVFDTNEKGAVKTKDTIRDTSKVYFDAIGGLTDSFTTGAAGGTVPIMCSMPNTTAYTVADSVATYSDNGKKQYLYAESVYDANGITYNQNFSALSDVTYPKWSTSLLECELPYITGTYVEKWLPNRTLAGIPAASPSAMPLADNKNNQYSGVVNWEGVNYAANTTSATSFYGYGRTATLNISNASSTVHALTICGPLYSDVAGIGKIDADYAAKPYTPTMGPRANAYADRFTRLAKYKTASGYQRRYRLLTGVKYFVPVELGFGQRMTNAAATAYTCVYKVRMRDCTEDVMSLLNMLKQAPTGDNRNYMRQESSTTWEPDALAILAGVATGGGDGVAEGSKILPKLFIPAQDCIYLAGKRYFKPTYVLTNDTTFAHGTFYYKAVTTDANGNQLVDGLGNPYTAYTRVRPESTSDSPKAKGYYIATWTELTEGTDYQVGDLIPMLTKTPFFYHSRKDPVSTAGDTGFQDNYLYYDVNGKPVDQPNSVTFSSDTYPTKRECFWTNGQVDPTTGEYVKLTTDFRGTTLPATTGLKATYDTTSVNAWRYTEIFEAPISYSDYNGSQFENCNVYWKTPCLERVAYGNHVWAQSNVRAYLNGPFDTSAEYIRTKDTSFGVTKPSVSANATNLNANYAYYAKVGANYVRLVKSTSSSASTYQLGENISSWETRFNREVYQRYKGGMPVGAKLEVHRPDRYDSFGRSPIQQYVWNANTSTWDAKFDEGDLWWGNGMTSINNDLLYDRLAGMYAANCIARGLDGNPQMRIGNVYPTGSTTQLVRSGSAYATDKLYEDTVNDDTGATLQYTSRLMMPRQSFLHGFLDCKYKRTSDITDDTSKTYYFRNPYGEYEVAEHNTALTSNPYQHVLYVLNKDYANDIETASDFLNAIVPVVNRNGCYGTVASYDFYSQEAAYNAGTVCIDKVWLMSTCQIAGGDAANNGVFENPKSNQELDDLGGYTTAKLALKMWRKYANKFSDYGFESLNDSRIKNLLTLGGHGTTGYADSTPTAAYWWLRSAGAAKMFVIYHERCQPSQMWTACSSDASWQHQGMFYDWATAQDVYSRLSPLISIG